MSSDDCGCNSCGCGAEEEAEEESFHPMGAEWEGEMEEMLDDTEYDTELGMQMAEDAMRLVSGELSEEEFQEQYHDAVIDEFGEDQRPTAEALEEIDVEDDGGMLEGLKNGGGNVVERLSGADVNPDQTRRETMKKIGAGAAALGFGGMVASSAGEGGTAAAQAAGNGDDGDGTQYGMVIDLERCDGCLQCVTACIEENNTSTGANWMYVMTYTDDRTNQENFLVRPCQHCSDAPCEKVCPVEARHTREKDGIVLTDYETCIGCRYCQVACPYGVNYFQWGNPDTEFDELDSIDMLPEELRQLEEAERNQQLTDAHDHVYDDRGRWVDSRPPQGTMGKCTFCPTRQDGHSGEEKVATTACEDACDTAGMSAIHFGDMNDPESRPQQYLQQRADAELEDDTEFEGDEEWDSTVTPWRKLSAFKLQEELGTDPNVVYLGNEPGPNAEQVEGPVSYEDIGATDNRKNHLDQGASANQAGGD